MKWRVLPHTPYYLLFHVISTINADNFAKSRSSIGLYNEHRAMFPIYAATEVLYPSFTTENNSQYKL
jgi:hypothetical protein